MRFYRATRFLFPSSVKLRLFAICFISTHLPLMSLILWEVWRGVIGWPETLIVLAATLAGTTLALTAIHALLMPVQASAEALGSLSEGRVQALDEMDSRDLMGALIASVNRAASSAGERMRQLDEAANHDQLTGLMNRRGFDSVLDSIGNRRPVGTLVLIDIDRFKSINDQHGHHAGDDVLRLFAHRLIGGLRRGDMIARWGGEEFVLFLPMTAPGDARAIIDRLAKACRLEPIASIGHCAVTFSAGLSVWPEGEPLHTALLRADTALYSAKRAGRDCIREAAHVEVETAAG